MIKMSFLKNLFGSKGPKNPSTKPKQKKAKKSEFYVKSPALAKEFNLDEDHFSTTERGDKSKPSEAPPKKLAESDHFSIDEDFYSAKEVKENSAGSGSKVNKSNFRHRPKEDQVSSKARLKEKTEVSESQEVKEEKEKKSADSYDEVWSSVPAEIRSEALSKRKMNQKQLKVDTMTSTELLDMAKAGHFSLDDYDPSIVPKLRDRFITMDKMEKRKYYKCGELYLIHEQIPAWQEMSGSLPEPTDSGRLLTDRAGVNVTLNQKVAIFQGDITQLEVDCIVNACSSILLDSPMGVNAAIRGAAGALLEWDLEVLWSVPSGSCVASAGYLLPAKYIFHTSGPSITFSDWADGTSTLGACYRSCLKHMVKLGLRTLAFPCISTGSKGIPREVAAALAVGTVRDWLEKEDNVDKVDKIIFCIFDPMNWKEYCKVMFHMFPPAKDVSSPVSPLPVEILRMDSHSIDLYKQALEEGKEYVHNIRIMIIGHYGVGKTTLARRLLGDDVDLTIRDSTNGIDVHICRCKVGLAEQRWISVTQDEKLNSTYKRLAKMLARQQQREDNSSERQAAPVAMPVPVEETEQAVGGQDLHDAEDEVDAKLAEDFTEKVVLEPAQLEEGDINANATFSRESSPEDTAVKDLKALIAEVSRTSPTETAADYADVSVWDFAGQFVFYSTHQMFLSSRAVYLLVTDISKHISDVVIEDECYFDSAGPKQCHISDFVDFWLNSIHSYTPGSSKGVPPVILVGTHADALTKELVEEPDFCTIDADCYRQKLSEAYFEAVRHHLSDKPTRYHLANEDFDIDNTVVDPKLEALKKKILEVASAQPYWGEPVPAKWLPLETALREVKEKGLKVIDHAAFEELNELLTVPISKAEELELFLRFQHESGNLLYFSDSGLSDKVVLDSQWLVDALKSLITAKMFCMKQPDIMEKWEEFFRNGILRKELLDVVWKRDPNPTFHDNREHLLALMEKLNLIAKPRSWLPEESAPTEEEYHLAPCMLKEPPPGNLLHPCRKSDCKCTSIVCFSFTQKFLPAAVFHRLIATCLSKWSLWRQGKKDLIFCGCGVFKVDTTHKLTVYLKQYVIEIWMTKFGLKDKFPSPAMCMEVREFIEDCLRRITGCLPQSPRYEVFIKCPKATFDCLDSMISVEALRSEEEIVCSSHADTHVCSSRQLMNYWYELPSRGNIENDHSDSTTSCLPDEVWDRCPDDKELGRVARQIGKEFLQLGLELGVRQYDIDRFRIEYPIHVSDQILAMLSHWRKGKGSEATFQRLETAMKAVLIDTDTAFRDVFDY